MPSWKSFSPNNCIAVEVPSSRVALIKYRNVQKLQKWSTVELWKIQHCTCSFIKAGAVVAHMMVFRIMMKQKLNDSCTVDVTMFRKIQVSGYHYGAQIDELTRCLFLGRLFIVSSRAEPEKLSLVIHGFTIHTTATYSPQNEPENQEVWTSGRLK